MERVQEEEEEEEEDDDDDDDSDFYDTESHHQQRQPHPQAERTVHQDGWTERRKGREEEAVEDQGNDPQSFRTQRKQQVSRNAHF